MSLRLRLFPLNAVLFPGTVLNLHVFEPRYKAMIGECLQSKEHFGAVLIREGAEAGDPLVVPRSVGCVAEIRSVTPLPFDRYYVRAVGRDRFRIRGIVKREPYLVAEVDLLHEDAAPRASPDDVPAQLLRDAAVAFNDYAGLLSKLAGQAADVDVPDDPQAASFIIADSLQVSDAVKQRLLESENAAERLREELRLLRRLRPHIRALLSKRAEEAERRRSLGPAEPQRREQERYFGKYFSSN